MSIQRVGAASIVVVSGVVDRELAGRIEALLQEQLIDDDHETVVDVTGVDAVNGALLGVLLRASRRLAWRNRRMDIICGDPELRSRLEIAGLDDLASLRERAYGRGRGP